MAAVLPAFDSGRRVRRRHDIRERERGESRAFMSRTAAYGVALAPESGAPSSHGRPDTLTIRTPHRSTHAVPRSPRG
jgi:hypothetical protein